MLKVVAVLLRQSKQTPDILELKRVFLSDMMALCSNSRDNKRFELHTVVRNLRREIIRGLGSFGNAFFGTEHSHAKTINVELQISSPPM